MQCNELHAIEFTLFLWHMSDDAIEGVATEYMESRSKDATECMGSRSKDAT